MRQWITLLCVGLWSGCSCDDASLGQLVPLLARDVDRLAFADTFVGGSRSLDLTLTNVGTANVSLDAARLQPAAFDVDDVAVDFLEPGQSLILSVTFTPSQPVDFAGALSLDSDGGDVVVVVDGTGLAPLLCDDGQECTNEFFDPVLGACVRSDREGSCDDRSACTEGDRCFAGACVGDALTCVDDVDCTLDVCDPARGCVFVGDDAGCVDNDPCTLDLCDASSAGSGCTNPPAPDFTPCGDVEECVSVSLCIVQQCTAVPIPEGTPCSDGDLCTADDRCTAGACGGTPFDRPPEVLSETFRILRQGPAVLVGDALIIGAPTKKIVRLTPEGGAPSTSIPALARSERLVRGGTHVAGLGRVPGSGTNGVGSAGFVTVVDVADLAHPALVGSVAVSGSELVLFGASESQVLLCNNSSLLAIDLVTLATTAPEDDGLCALAARGPPSSVVFEGTHAVIGPGPDDITVTVAFVDVDTVILRDVVPPPEYLRAPREQLLDGNRAAGFNGDARGQVLLIDLDDVGAPVSAIFDAAVLGSQAFAVALQEPWLYFATAEGLRRVDVSHIDAPVVDGWGVDVPPPGLTTLSVPVLAVDDDHLVFIDSAGTVQAASALGSALVEAFVLSAQRPLGLLVDGDRTLLSTTNSAMAYIDDDTDDALVDSAVLVRGLLASTPVLVSRLQVAHALFTPVLHPDDGAFADSGILGVDVAGRRDLRAPLEPNDGRTLGRVGLFENFAAFGFGLSVVWPERVSSLAAPVAKGCLGAALAQPAEAEGVDGEPAVFAFSLSICVGSGVDVVPLGSVATPFDRNDVAVASSVQHGERVSFIGADEAVLVDLSDPLVPVIVAAVELPELEGAQFASAGADADAWMLAFTYLDGGPPRVVLYDVAAGAVLRESFDDGAAEALNQTVRKRVLGVRWPRAFLSSHDVNEAAERGWSIAAWDIESDPPVVVDTFAISGEPVDMVIDEERLIVSRADGLTVISPPCGP